MVKAIQTHSGETEDHTKETTEITTKGPEFEMLSQDMKMPQCYFRDMLVNKHEMTLCDLGSSVGIMLRVVFEKLHLPFEPMAMCLELGDNSIHYPVGIAEDAPVKVGEIKFDINGERSVFKFQPRFEACNMFNVKYIPPHLALSRKSQRGRKRRRSMKLLHPSRPKNNASM
jgi:hypothetical protein